MPSTTPSAAPPTRHPATWIWGGLLIALSAIPPLLQVFGYYGLRLDWGVMAAIAQPAALLFPLGLAFLAVGLRPDESVVARRPLGVAALFVVGLTDVMQLVPAFGATVLVVPLIMLKGAAAVVAVTVILRVRVVPRPTIIAGVIAFIVTALAFAVSIFVSYTADASAGMALALFLVAPLTALAKIAQLALGIVFIAAPKSPARR